MGYDAAVAKQSEAKGTYYYAGGQRVPLEAAPDLVAIDTAIAQELSSAAAQGALAKAKALRGGVALAEAASVPAPALAELRERGALHPVLRFGADLVVVLPEVRVEESRPEKIRELRRWLDGARTRIRCSGTLEGGRLEIRPASGRGQDALEIANELHERVDPELAQARFIRVVRRPDAMRAKAGR